MAHREFNYKNRHIRIEDAFEDEPDKVQLYINGREIELIQNLDTGEFQAPNELFVRFQSLDDLAKNIIDINQPT